MQRADRKRSRGDFALRLLFPMVSFKDAFWIPMMAAAVPAAPFGLAWRLAVAELACLLLPAWYVSFLVFHCTGFALVLILAAALAGCFWICEKSRPHAGDGPP